MQLSDGKNAISHRVAMAIVALVLVTACLTGCGTGGNHATTSASNGLAVVDTSNNRVLLYNTPLSTGQSASVVLGQADFTTLTPDTLTATSMFYPTDTAEDSNGNIYVSDTLNNRVLQFKPPFTNGMSASLVIGQPDFVIGDSNTTQNGLSQPAGLAIDGSGNLWVADYFNNRILQYKPPFATGMNASLVIGQADFTSGAFGGATTPSRLTLPMFMAFDASGNLWLTDNGNNRALEFKPPFATGMSASLVIGQADFFSSGADVTANNLFSPTGISFDSAGNLWIGDTNNNRVLQFEPAPAFTNGMSASLVLGQPDFVTDTFNFGTQNGFVNPFGIAFESNGNLLVSDLYNSRTMAFKPPFSNDQNADGVLGQPDFTTFIPTTTATGQSFPTSVRPLF